MPKKNAKFVDDYFSTFIENAVIDLQQITKTITDPNEIEFFKLNLALIEKYFKNLKVEWKFDEIIPSVSSF